MKPSIGKANRAIGHRILNKADVSFISGHPSPESGAEGIRTPDLLLAKQALSQLSYSPTVNYCIRCYVMVKASPFFVYGIAAILMEDT
jgi:hypothetical protein